MEDAPRPQDGARGGWRALGDRRVLLVPSEDLLQFAHLHTLQTEEKKGLKAA